MIVTRTEQHILKPNNPYFKLLADYCHASKNLWNHANFEIRHHYFKTGEYLDYYKLDKILKQDTNYPDYRAMPSAASAQQLLRLLDTTWKSFFRSIKEFKANPSKYSGRPKPPRYKKKDGHSILIFNNQEVRRKDSAILLPRKLNGFTIQSRCFDDNRFHKINQVRIVPRTNKLVIEVIYEINIPDTQHDNNQYAAIDIGVDNLVTISTNIDCNSIAISGRPLKSINQWYNKSRAHYSSILKTRSNRFDSLRLQKITEKRNRKIKDYLHKTSKEVIDYCIDSRISKLVIGYNKGWKQASNLGKRINQNFVTIPFYQLIQMIQYKAEEIGVEVILIEESYTSGTSFIDDELPTKEFYNIDRRIERGLFKSNHGTLINADLNASYQIMKKVFPIKWDSRCVLHPVVVSIS